LYSPNIKEPAVRRLYKLAKLQKRPMTHLVADAIAAYLPQHSLSDETAQPAATDSAYVLTESGRAIVRRRAGLAASEPAA